MEFLIKSKNGQWSLVKSDKAPNIKSIIQRLKQPPDAQGPSNTDLVESAKTKLRQERAIPIQGEKAVEMFDAANAPIVAQGKVSQESLDKLKVKREKIKSQKPNEVPFNRLQNLLPEEKHALGEHLKTIMLAGGHEQSDGTKKPLAQHELNFLVEHLGSNPHKKKDISSSQQKIIRRSAQDPMNPALPKDTEPPTPSPKPVQQQQSEKQSYPYNFAFMGHDHSLTEENYNKLSDDSKKMLHDFHNNFLKLKRSDPSSETRTSDDDQIDEYINRLKALGTSDYPSIAASKQKK